MSGVGVDLPDGRQAERSDPPRPPVPHMPRHRSVFLASYLCLLFPATAGGLWWLGRGDEMGEGYLWLFLVTLAFVPFALLGGRVDAWTEDDGIHIVNAFRTFLVPWDEVVRVREEEVPDAEDGYVEEEDPPEDLGSAIRLVVLRGLIVWLGGMFYFLFELIRGNVRFFRRVKVITKHQGTVVALGWAGFGGAQFRQLSALLFERTSSTRGVERGTLPGLEEVNHDRAEHVGGGQGHW